MPRLSCCHIDRNPWKASSQRSPRPRDILSGLKAFSCWLMSRSSVTVRGEVDVPKCGADFSWQSRAPKVQRHNTPGCVLLHAMPSHWRMVVLLLIAQYSCWITSDGLLNTKQGTYVRYSDGRLSSGNLQYYMKPSLLLPASHWGQEDPLSSAPDSMSITTINAVITMMLLTAEITWFEGWRIYMLMSSLRPLSGGDGKEGRWYPYTPLCIHGCSFKRWCPRKDHVWTRLSLGVFAEDEVKTMLHNMFCKHSFAYVTMFTLKSRAWQMCTWWPVLGNSGLMLLRVAD
jgi:hypothetical protein